MDQQRIIFESSPGFVFLCILAGLGYAYLLYRGQHSWSRNMNRLFFCLRAVLVFFLAFLLLGPIVRQIRNLLEKPVFVVLQDNSRSISEAVDSTTLSRVSMRVAALQKTLEEKGFDVAYNDLQGDEIKTVQFKGITSDLQGALRNVSASYEGRKLGGVLLVSDGIYNSGLSPLYANYNFPVHTLGLGDTAQRIDITIRNIAFNKIAYQGNRFPIRAEVLVTGLPEQDLTVTLLHKGAVVEKQTRKTGRDQLLSYDFQPLANEQGIQKYTIQVEVKPEEYNMRNNQASVFVEVVEGKKKVLLVAPSPHPDIKALRTVIMKNANYDFLLHIPGISEQQPSVLRPDQVDMAIFHGSPDQRGKTRELFQQFSSSKTAMFILLGRQSDLAAISRQNMPLRMESLPRDYDEVTPVINPGFGNFTLSTETNTIIADYPPVSVPFGKLQVPLSATSLLYQRVGSVATNRPLLAVEASSDRKVAIMLGEGIWRWRLDEYERVDNAQAFDELFGKLIQYLSTTDDKRKFRSYPVQQEFSDAEAVVFESQVYNDIFEPIYGNTIDIELTDEGGRKSRYTYAISPGNIRYQIGGLKEGVYRYNSKTIINNKPEEVHGQFAVVARVAELQNLTADFAMLRKLSSNTGGHFYTVKNMDALEKDLTVAEASGVLRSEETFDSLINLKWIFWLLLGLATAEWFLRKYYGSY